MHFALATIIQDHTYCASTHPSWNCFTLYGSGAQDFVRDAAENRGKLEVYIGDSRGSEEELT